GAVPRRPGPPVGGPRGSVGRGVGRVVGRGVGAAEGVADPVTEDVGVRLGLRVGAGVRDPLGAGRDVRGRSPGRTRSPPAAEVRDRAGSGVRVVSDRPARSGEGPGVAEPEDGDSVIGPVSATGTSGTAREPVSAGSPRIANTARIASTVSTETAPTTASFAAGVSRLSAARPKGRRPAGGSGDGRNAARPRSCQSGPYPATAASAS